MRYRNRYLICSHRIKNWNYASRGWYFITIATHNRIPLFGYIKDGVMYLNECGQIVAEEWENSKEIRPYMRFDTYVVMPDHVHFLVQLKHNQHYIPRHFIGKVFKRLSRSIPSFVAAIKRICTIRIRVHLHQPHMRIWQANYHDSIPRTPTHVNAVRRYIRNNPRNANNTPIPHLLHYNTSRHVNTP
jgi:REP element-mobilizing transposase RayT